MQIAKRIPKPIKKILIALVVISLLVGTYFLKMYYIDEQFFFFGTKLFIRVNEYELIDYTKIDIDKKEDGVRKMWFDSWGNDREREGLINYMKENNLKIKTGLYRINQNDRFVKVKRNLEFEKIK